MVVLIQVNAAVEKPLCGQFDAAGIFCVCQGVDANSLLQAPASYRPSKCTLLKAEGRRVQAQNHAQQAQALRCTLRQGVSSC